MNPEFYEDEVIEGFYVPSMLKCAWGAQMDVLKETDAICRRHNIPYFADWGTLLAAIRHSGYIPWDDDLDISMRRKDYNRFLEYAEKELPEGFKVMHFKNHPGHHFFVARIVGKPRICFEQDHLTRFHGFPYIAGVDLFVLDNVCINREKEHLKSKKAEFVITVADNIADGAVKGRQAQDLLTQCEAYTGKRIDRRLSGEALRVRLYELAEELFASIPDEESDALVQMMPFGMYGREKYIPKEYYRSTVRLPYMDTTIEVPLCYDAVMRMKFGDYMVIRKEWGGHDYPFFYGQHQDLVAVLDFEYPAYRASKEDLVSAADRDPGRSEGTGDVVLMPFAAKYWKYMEKLYRYYTGEGTWNVHVVPIPYFYKAWDGTLSEEVFDPGDYPDDIRIEDYRNLDLERMHPAVIVIQNPFDEWNSVYSVPPVFYSKRIKAFTDKLIYVPFFVTSDFIREMEREYINMDSYVCMPGVINADCVLLPTEAQKKVYIQKILEFTGASDEEAGAVLDEKLSVRPDLVFTEGGGKDPAGRDGQKEKKIVYFTTISFLAERGHDAIEKIRRNLDIFEKASDRISVVWITQCISGNTQLLDKDVAKDFLETVRRFKASGIGEYVEDISVQENTVYARMCDMYYGGPSSLALRFFYEHKPVMLENADV